MKKKQSKPQRGRRSKVRALVPLDTEKIRKNELTKFKRSKTTCAKLTDQVEQFEKNEVPAFSKWLHAECEATLQKMNTLRGKAFTLQHTLDLAEELHLFYRCSPKECGDAAVHYIETNGEIPKGFESFFQENSSTDTEQEELDDPDAEAARQFFDSLMDDFDTDAYADDPDFPDPFGPREKTSNEKNTLKKLYRKITHKLHPDRVGNATPEQQDLWHAAQKAYKMQDLETLQHIETSCDLFNDTLIRFASVSSIQNGTDFYKQTNTKIRRALRLMKKELEWGFLSWTDRKKKRVLKKYTDDLNDDLTILALQYSSMQHDLDQIRKMPRTKKTNRKGSATVPPVEQDTNQGQFDFF
jgi:hypothetical protein